MNDLYFIQRGHYLIQYKDGYSQFTTGQINKSGKRIKSIMDWQFQSHLDGDLTIGTFGGKLMSKFMTFDIDFHDLKMAQWIVYKLTKTLYDLGINEHYISFSGNKGYHIDIFFSDLIQISDAEKFFNYVILKSDTTQYFLEGSKVEFRVTDKLGIKLPLGIHQKTGNYCGFCVLDDGLTVMDKANSEAFFFTIKKISHQRVLDIIGIEDVDIFDRVLLTKAEDAISPHTPLKNYEQSEDYSIDLAIELFNNGLKYQGSRHKSTLLLGMYFKYCGMDQEQCKDELSAWMSWQKSETYTTPLLHCYKDIVQITKDIYEKNYNLRSNDKDMTVTFEEIQWIINSCPEKNQKLITYAMLIHSKRHANLKGVFYMPFKDIETTTGLGENTVPRQVNKLIDCGVIEVIERNRKPKGGGLMKKLPNLYRLNYKPKKLSLSLFIESDETFVTSKSNNLGLCMKFYFTDAELKKLLPRRQYESIMID